MTHHPIILIVDDSAEDPETYRRYLLGDDGDTYKILAATSGEEGLALCLREVPDLVLLDYWLPDMNGEEFLENLERSLGCSPPPTIVLTGQGDTDIAVEVMKRGARDYLVKGKLTSKGINRAVRTVLTQVQLEQRLEEQRERQELLGAIAFKIRQSLDVEQIFTTTIQEVRRLLSLERVAIYRFYPDWNGEFVADSIGDDLARSPLPIPAIAPNDALALETSQQTLHFHRETFVPILQGEKLWGLLVAYHSQTTNRFYEVGGVRRLRRSPHRWQEEEANLLAQVGIQLGVALQQAELLATTQQQATELSQALQNMRHHARDVEAANRELQATRDFINSIINAVSDPIFVKDDQHRWVLMNDSCCELIGCRQGELIGKSDYDVFPTEQADIFWERDDHVLATGEVDECEEYLTDVRGNTHYLSTKKTRYTDSQGNKFIVASIRDLTDRRRMEEALRESEERFALAMAGANDGVWDWDLRTNKVYRSPRWCRMLGYTNDEWGQAAASFQQIIHPEDKEWVLSTQEAYLQGKLNHYRVEFRALHRDGSYRWILSRGAALRDEAGVAYRFSGSHTDITERKQFEEQLQRSLEQAKELSELRSRIVTMVSHEYRTPLTTISMSAELLQHYRHKWAEDKQEKHFQRIRAAVVHMTNLINDVLFLNQVEMSKLAFRPAPLDLLEFCREMLDTMQLTAGADRTLRFLPEGDFSNAHMDEHLLRQILTNLLSNAIKYSPQGGDVEMHMTHHQHQVVFQVRDRGIGIPQADQERLFESFHRASNTGTIQGTGLGLAIVKRCVDLHNGEIDFDTEEGVGTTFTVRLPVRSA